MEDEERSWQVQGRSVTCGDLVWIRQYRAKHPEARRKRIAMALCEHWQWRNGRGHIKEMAARTLLNKLADRGLIELPPLRKWVKRNVSDAHCTVDARGPGLPIEGSMSALQPLHVEVVEQGHDHQKRWAGYLRDYHYLGLHIVGENMGYLISDRQGRDVAALLFGAAAWRCSARDRYIGWMDGERAQRLSCIANNTRFLILPWVRVEHLASHVLGKIQRQVNKDWQAKYSHGLQWLETFVDTERFAGTCYRAANWVEAGRTQGRTRQDRHNKLQVSRKYVLLYALNPRHRIVQ